MRCHYEVLEVPQNADDSEIRRAYKKLALRWHPDKNLDDVDNAKIQFQAVQQAYEVLSDHLERRWYDSHREQILREKSDFEDNSLDLYQYFRTTCFKGFGDDDGGFYAVYRKVFETILKEDIKFMNNKGDLYDIPTFGTSSSSYNDVVGPFYAYWLGYSTKKSFVWLDPHGIQDIRGSRLYKILEKENQKIRTKAKQEWNEEVRALVTFVRKRDKRVLAHAKLEEARILKNRHKQEELSQSRRLQRRKELSEMKSEVEWVKFDNLKGQLKEIEKELAKEFGEKLSDDEDDSESEFLDNLYCAACNKIFKTPKAFQNHEISKKHKENVEKLREHMMEEDEIDEEENEIDLNGDDAAEEKVDDEVLSEDLIEEEEVEEVKTKKSKRKSKKVMQMNFSVSDHEDVTSLKVDPEEEPQSTEDLVLTKKQKRRSKKNKASDKTLPNGSSVDNENLEKVEIEEDMVEKPKSNKKTKKGAEGIDDIDVAHCCVSCHANFPSKNKLFDHLKKTGHGVQLPQITKSIKNKKKKKF